MNLKTIALFLLSGLLTACTAAMPSSLPEAAISPTASPSPSQTPLPTLTPTSNATQTSTPTLTLTTEANPGLERVAQTGGSINGITIVGDVAYVGMGPRVAAIDISQHESPRLVSQSEPLPGLVTQLITISDGSVLLLLVNAGKYLVVIDTSSPDELKPIQQLQLEGAITAMVWDDQASVLYAGMSVYQRPTVYTGLISAVDVTSDHQLKLLNSVSMPEWPMSLALGKSSLFAGAQGYEGGLYLIQVNTPGELSTPYLVIASTPETALQPISMRVIGERLYLSYRDIEAYDITNPGQPLKIWKQYTGGNVVADFNFAEEKIYFFGWTILSEYVRGASTAPEPIVGSPVGQTASVTAIHKGDFLVAYNDLEIYDTANPQDLSLVSSYQPPVIHGIGAAANEKAVYVFDIGDEGSTTSPSLRVLSLPDLKPLGQVRTEFSTWYQFVGIALEGDRVYIAYEDGLWVYDISSSEPILLEKAGFVDGKLTAIAAIKLGEKRLLVTSHVSKDHTSVLTVYNLTNLQKPAILGNPVTLDQGDTSQITWESSAFYVLLERSYFSKSDMLYVIDFDGNALELRVSLEVTGYIKSMAVVNNLITLAGVDIKMYQSFVSLVEPESVKLLSQTTLPEYGMGLGITRDRAWVVVGDDYSAAQLLIYVVQDPAYPKLVEAMDIATSSNFIVPILVTNSYVVVVNGSGGVEVFNRTV